MALSDSDVHSQEILAIISRKHEAILGWLTTHPKCFEPENCMRAGCYFTVDETACMDKTKEVRRDSNEQITITFH